MDWKAAPMARVGSEEMGRSNFFFSGVLMLVTRRDHLLCPSRSVHHKASILFAVQITNNINHSNNAWSAIWSLLINLSLIIKLWVDPRLSWNSSPLRVSDHLKPRWHRYSNTSSGEPIGRRGTAHFAVNCQSMVQSAKPFLLRTIHSLTMINGSRQRDLLPPSSLPSAVRWSRHDRSANNRRWAVIN